MRHPLRWTLLLAVAAAFTAAPAAHAACGPGTSQPFERYLDPFWYRLADGGDVGGGAAGWELANGARGVASQSAPDLAGSGESWVLRLPAGGSAVSPPSCVALNSPTLRFMARSTGSPLGVLLVTAVIRQDGALLGRVPLGVVTGLGSSWKPSLPMLLPTANLVALDGSLDVALRFTTTGLGGAFEVDDVFIDPYRKN